MEGLMFVDGVYPDFSLLEEVLLPPYFESAPCITIGDPQSEAITRFAQSQYREQPLDAAAALNESDQTANSALQYRRRSSRGRKRGGCNNRPFSVNVDTWCLRGNHTKNSVKIGHKMSCVTKIEHPSIIYLLEESMRKLPKTESNLEDDPATESSGSMTEDHLRTPSVQNGYRTAQSSSGVAGNAMELLNLINVKCSHLNKLGGPHLRIEDTTDQQWRNGGGNPKTVDDNPNSDIPHKVLDSNCRDSIMSGGPLSEDENRSTSGVSSVERGDNATGDSSLLNTSTDSETCVRKTPRKQRTPTKGVEKQDPSFKGIEFQMQLRFGEKYDDCRLILTSFYSRGRSRRKGTKSRLRFKSTSLSSGSEDDQVPASSSKNKRCASCKTQKTPLWRDAEDGTPLCNACGIRYKKYGRRCGRCWNIPKKDGKSCSGYCACGGMYRAPL
ncbi:GATA-type zinc finger protein 1 [Leptodactylus fuscus]